VGEVALIRHTISHFACVDRTFVKSISSRRRPEKKERIAGEGLPLIYQNFSPRAYALVKGSAGMRRAASLHSARSQPGS
jgi:hypothetical protein